MRSAVGVLGEDIAVKYLKSNGYFILERNFFVRFGEIDIITKKENKLIFVEVKTRVGSYYGKPYEAVSQKKIQKIYAAGQLYSSQKKVRCPMRIDVISIVLEQTHEVKYLYHIKNIEV